MSTTSETSGSMSAPETGAPIGGDVCIVGGGPAGLILARELTGKGLHVLLLESGPPDVSEQDLSRAEVTGDPINALNLELTRERRLGGNANAWVIKTGHDDDGWTYGVRYGPQTAAALGSRPWIPESGWPIGSDDVLDCTRRAHELLADGEFNYDSNWAQPDQPSQPWTSDSASVPPWIETESLVPRYFAFGPRSRFLVDLRNELQSNPRLEIVEGATVTRLHQVAAGASVDRLTYRDQKGQAVTIGVNRVVLAGGGVENARLLLASEKERGGIGNETDNVGRYFMDHPLWAVGDIKLRDTATLADLGFFDFQSVDGATRHGHLVTSRAWCEANTATEIGVALLPRPRRRVGESIDNMKYIASNPRHYASHPRDLAQAGIRVMAGLDRLPWAAYLSRKQSVLPGFGRGGWSTAEPTKWFRELEVVFQCEQPPLRDSRVTLSDQRDRFGTPLPKLTWRLGEQTQQSVLALQRLVAERVESNSIGSYVPRSGSLDALRAPTSIAHHMGSTRMSLTADDGVVDVDCRVHTCPNLFMAGSSVFPVGGYVNPTLTIAALAIRLAETIAKDTQAATIGADSSASTTPRRL